MEEWNIWEKGNGRAASRSVVKHCEEVLCSIRRNRKERPPPPSNDHGEQGGTDRWQGERGTDRRAP